MIMKWCVVESEMKCGNIEWIRISSVKGKVVKLMIDKFQIIWKEEIDEDCVPDTQLAITEKDKKN